MLKMKKTKTRIVAMSLMLLLSGSYIISNAENIPLTNEEISRAGNDNVGLVNGIGVIIFDLSNSNADDNLKSGGHLGISNTYNESFTFSAKIITELSPVDLENGNPRIHKTISNSTLFYPLPDASWIKLESDKVIVDPLSYYSLGYTITIPQSEASKMQNGTGYLLYINIKKSLDNKTGARIGIDYNYKLFIIFSGKVSQGASFIIGGWFIVPLALIIGIVSVSVVYAIKRRKPKPSAVQAPKQAPKIRQRLEVSKKIDTDISSKIDKILNSGRGIL